MAQAATAPIEAPDSIAVNLGAFTGSLRADHKAERTVEAYPEAVIQLDRFLARRGMPQDVRHLRREHVEEFIIELLAKFKPSTANNRHRGCQAFFRWCVNEDVIADTPMAKMKPPRVPDVLVPILPLEVVSWARSFLRGRAPRTRIPPVGPPR